MYWNENKLPEENFPLQYDFFFPQIKKEDQNMRVEVTANSKPRDVKESRDGICDDRRNFFVAARAVITSVHQTTAN